MRESLAGMSFRTEPIVDPHLNLIRPVTPRTPEGCEECLQIGSPWVHLRLCLSCGHVGCCDSSPLRHAHSRAFSIGHPIVQSIDPWDLPITAGLIKAAHTEEWERAFSVFRLLI